MPIILNYSFSLHVYHNSYAAYIYVAFKLIKLVMADGYSGPSGCKSLHICES